MPRRTADQMIAVDEDDRFAAEVLAVVDSLERRQVVGLLGETHALRGYSDASERQRRGIEGSLVVASASGAVAGSQLMRRQVAHEVETGLIVGNRPAEGNKRGR